MPASTFLTSAANLSQCPRDSASEIAFIGRSNVGKSSILSELLGNGSLVRRSRTPGRTQLLNFFADGEGHRFVDLPGYGYADMPLNLQHDMQALVEEYVREREQLLGVVLLVDARRQGPTEQDKAWFEFAQFAGRRVQVAMTKCDRIAKAQRKPQVQIIERAMFLGKGQVLMCSAVSKEGIKDLRGLLAKWRAL